MEENMNNNGTQQVENGTNPQTAPQGQQQMVVPIQPAVVEPPKQPNWFKRNWKKVAAGGAAIAAAVGSAFVAYNKGKHVGMNYYQPQEGEDYSLNPNVE